MPPPWFWLALAALGLAAGWLLAGGPAPLGYACLGAGVMLLASWFGYGRR